ncbi:MAG: hypothetical protein JWO15_2069 [Sphingomonadales bacterium]|nr:hypothetical protein [Sphingomonadales bacterium]
MDKLQAVSTLSATLEDIGVRMTAIIAHVQEDGRKTDAGTLYKIGRLQARVYAARALAETDRPDEASIFASELLLDIGRVFPSVKSSESTYHDENEHLHYQAIGQRYLVDGLAL